MKNLSVGFTGTRTGMTQNQKLRLASILCELASRYSIYAFHHGDCIGADEQFHDIVLMLFNKPTVILHPCNLKSQRAFCTDENNPKATLRFFHHEDVFPPPLVRNKEIVQNIDFLIAAPATAKEQLRSGTWATIRYLNRNSKARLAVLHP